MAVGALVPIIIGAGNVIRMASPKVAQMLIKKGVGKKASQAAVKKLRSPAKRINAKDANKLASQDAGTIRRATKALGKTSPKVKGSKPNKGKSSLKKIGIGAGIIAGGAAINEALDKNKSVKSKTKTSLPAKRKVTLKRKASPDDVMRKERDNVKKIKGGVKTSDVTLKSKASPDDVMRKERDNVKKIKGGVKTSDVTIKKSNRKGKIATADEAMSIGEYLKGAIGLRGKEGLEGKKRLVKTPFGNVTVDTSPEAFEEPEEYKVGGRVKRNLGGKVRGVGQAVKGFGKATYSDKFI